MSARLNLLFYLNKSKKNAMGKCPLVLRITYAQERRQVSTGFTLTPHEWEILESGKRGKDKELNRIKEALETFKAKVFRMANSLEMADSMDIDALIEAIQERPKKITLMRVFNQYMEQLKSRLEINYAKASFMKMVYLGHKLEEFLTFQYGKEDLRVDKLQPSFIQLFLDYLLYQKKVGKNTAIKYCRNLKQVIKFAKDRGFTESDPFSSFRSQAEDVERAYLTAAELEALEVKPISNTRLSQIRDLFLFQCYTGLSYTDMGALKPQHLEEGPDGRNWIVIRRQKTKIKSTIPILPPAQSILIKYQNANREVLLPQVSNQKFNAYLKEIADICGINKKLTTHCGRRTFATTVALGNGVSLETIARILGHKNTKMTSIYAVVTDLRLSKEMEELSKKLLTNNKSSNS